MVRFSMPSALVLLALAACAGSPSRPPPAADSATDYGTASRCLSTFAYDAVEILDSRHLLFLGREDIWLNRLLAPCPGLGRHATLSFEVMGNRLCRLDHAQVLSGGAVGQLAGPLCSLGEFQQLSEAQAGLIREAL